MNMTKRLFAAVMLLVATSVAVVAANIKGKVVDRQTGEALIGATVMVGDNGCATDVNGEFELKGLKRGNLSIIIKEERCTHVRKYKTGISGNLGS